MTQIVLSPETQKLLEQRLQSGEYRSADDLLHAALEALDNQDGQLSQSTLDAIDEAERQIEQGNVREWSRVREEVRSWFRGKNSNA